ncbi:MAG: hypothetical protein HFJ80_07500 [Clostridiales bacterium]|nr:hypothetical protein [Clostridiales bacterium]
MKRKTQHILRLIISSFIAFIMALLLFLLAAGSCLSVTIFNQDFVLKRLEKANYYQKSADTILDQMKSLPGGVPAEIYDGVIDADLVYKDIVNGVTAAFTGDSSYRLDLQPLKEDLMSRFTTYAAENELVISDESAESLQTLVDTCTKLYRDQVTIPFVDTFGQIRMLFFKGYTIGIVVIVLLCALLILFLLSIRRFKHRAVRYLVYSLSGAALMMSVFPIYILMERAYERIHLSPQYVYDAFVDLVSSSMSAMLVGGAILLALALALLPLIHLLKKTGGQRKRSSSSPSGSQLKS